MGRRDGCTWPAPTATIHFSIPSGIRPDELQPSEATSRVAPARTVPGTRPWCPIPSRERATSGSAAYRFRSGWSGRRSAALAPHVLCRPSVCAPAGHAFPGTCVVDPGARRTLSPAEPGDSTAVSGTALELPNQPATARRRRGWSPACATIMHQLTVSRTVCHMGRGPAQAGVGRSLEIAQS